MGNEQVSYEKRGKADFHAWLAAGLIVAAFVIAFFIPFAKIDESITELLSFGSGIMDIGGALTGDTEISDAYSEIADALEGAEISMLDFFRFGKAMYGVDGMPYSNSVVEEIVLTCAITFGIALILSIWLIIRAFRQSKRNPIISSILLVLCYAAVIFYQNFNAQENLDGEFHVWAYLPAILVIIAFIFMPVLKKKAVPKEVAVRQQVNTAYVPQPMKKDESNRDSNQKRFCPNCGTELTGTEKFCKKCGFEISK